MSQPLSPRAAPSHTRVTRVTISQPSSPQPFGPQPSLSPRPPATHPAVSLSALRIPVIPSEPALGTAAPGRTPLTHTPLTRTSRQLLGLYLVALLALAGLGVQNQLGYARHDALLSQKRMLQLHLQRLRQETASVSGALEIRHWALEQGMVAAPEALNVRTAAATPAPASTPLESELELYTLWR